MLKKINEKKNHIQMNMQSYMRMNDTLFSMRSFPKRVGGIIGEQVVLEPLQIHVNVKKFHIKLGPVLFDWFVYNNNIFI